MRPDRRQQIEKLYSAAKKCEPGRQAAFLDRACAGDEELRKEVESLLASNAEAGDFLDTITLVIAAEEIAQEQSRSLVGCRFGNYRILSLLGAGGMGEVYLAEDARLRRKVALKLLPNEFTQDRERLGRFEQEAHAASALNHPNIVTIFEIGQVEGMHFIATEYIDGQTLRERLRSTPVMLPEALDVATQAASALAAAHDAGIVHRDIKPENIMIRRDGYIKVLDFGLAKLNIQPPAKKTTVIDEKLTASTQFKTDPGKMIGTPRYMSPEQIRGEGVDGRSDIFSLGVVLYELVAGRAPFDGASAGEIVAAILKQEPASLARYTRRPPAELQRMVSKTLAKDWASRYQLIKDLVADLKSLKLELELEAKLRRAGRAGERGDDEQSDLPTPKSMYLTDASESPASPPSLDSLEPVSGAVPLDSEFYIVRTTDAQFQSAIARQDSIVLVKGARQVGKTSLLARGMQQAREAGIEVILTDLQSLNQDCLASVEEFFLTLAGLMADQLDLDVFPREVWSPHFSASINFERYLRREVLAKITSPIVWGMDEVDRLFTCNYGSEVFGLFRSWHNKRALDPTGPWRRLTLVIAYATEAHLFITDLNQSPFNVGTRLELEDFTPEQVAELNRHYGSPLRDRSEVTHYFQLVGGHPYLVHRGIYEMAARRLDLTALRAEAQRDEGPFGDHLRRILVSLSRDPTLCEVVRGVLKGHTSLSTDNFYRLRSAGLITGDSVRDVKPRSQLYANYLGGHLL